MQSFLEIFTRKHFDVNVYVTTVSLHAVWHFDSGIWLWSLVITTQELLIRRSVVLTFHHVHSFDDASPSSSLFEKHQLHSKYTHACPNIRPQSRGLQSLTAGLQFVRLASRLKPWLRTIDGFGWLIVASHGLQVQTRKINCCKLAHSVFSRPY